MNKKSSIIFYIVLFLFVAAVFLANYNHFLEQGVYVGEYLKLANNILDGIGYNYTTRGLEPAFYPMWGYPLILALGIAIGHPALFLLFIQYILCILGIFYFYKIFEIKKRIWHIPLFLPFIAILSVKLPDAIVAFLLIIYVYFSYVYLKTRRIILLFLPGLILGIIGNFRSEYLYLPLLQLGIIFLPCFRTYRKSYFILVVTTFIVMIGCLLPWAIRSYNYSSQLLFSSTNSGGVLYISLGQLPNNPWGLTNEDGDATRYVRSMGEDNPYSINGDRLLQQKFLTLIRESPIVFTKKVTYNFLHSLRGDSYHGGIYTGEYYTLFMTQERFNEVKLLINERGINFVIANLNLKELIGFLVTFIINQLFRIVFLALVILFIYSLFLYQKSEKMILLGILIPIVLYKFILISLIQYEARHMNAIYLILLGVGFLATPVIQSIYKNREVFKKQYEKGNQK